MSEDITENGPYDGITSPYIQERLSQTSWEDHGEIDDIIRLEKLMRNGYHGMASSMNFHGLKGKYPDAYLALAKEIDPDLYDRVKAEQAEQNEKRAQASLEAEKRTCLAKESWKRAGGPG